jgi:hypothetical protein
MLVSNEKMMYKYPKQRDCFHLQMGGYSVYYVRTGTCRLRH